MRRTGSILAIIVFLLAADGYAGDFTGKVVGITDGDTLAVLHNGRGEKIRLHGIDCPENGQAFGKRAKQTASKLAFGQEVTVQTFGLDKYDRIIGDVTLPDGMSLNHELVRQGMCWWYRKYAPNERELEKLEVEARSDKRGLWADPTPVPPWAYRKLRRGQQLDPLDVVPIAASTPRRHDRTGAARASGSCHRPYEPAHPR